MPYTKAQEAALTKAAPVSFEDAALFAAEFGVSQRSVIAKVKSLDLEYIPKEVAPKRPRGVTKAQLVAAIEDSRGLPAGALDGLEKASARALNILLGS